MKFSSLPMALFASNILNRASLDPLNAGCAVTMNGGNTNEHPNKEIHFQYISKYFPEFVTEKSKNLLIFFVVYLYM